MKTLAPLALILLVAATPSFACSGAVTVCDHDIKGAFALIGNGEPAALLIDTSADPAVQRAQQGFAEDLERVSGKPAAKASDATGNLVIAGVVGQSKVIDELARAGKIDVADLPGQWEAYKQIVVEHPFPGVPRALVVAGADRRGVVFGLYDISDKICVSPWYWFADVPVAHRANVYLTAGARRDQPKVRYRGFFINDEAPAFSTWAAKHFGGANSKMYEHVFDLLLRLKGNYLWPAMWAPRAFNDDDPDNKVLADSMGVVMGTSHHEPMTRAQDEWHRNVDQGVTGGKWDYTVNAENLRKFWRGGIERMMSKGDGKGYESLITVGMRGDGDEPMAEGTATQLLETIVADQRKIIADVTGRPADQQPQVWALYKEVQDYYDHGMRVPDDVILLFADDNWGQIRRLPTTDLDRRGGYGIYYHFDYVGAPRNYKWIDTNQIEKSWQQMDLAYRRGARALWIVNVGDIKPMEFPLSFFMAQAWDPEAMTPQALANYPGRWAQATFGPKQATEIASLVTRYSQLASIRKPELLDQDSFPLGGMQTDSAPDGRDFHTLMQRWDKLTHDLATVKLQVPAEQQDAFYQLVEFPITALENVWRMYYLVGLNAHYARLNHPFANLYGLRAQTMFARDAEYATRYHAIHAGKWDGMMLQTHIGYTNWQQPDTQVMPKVKFVENTNIGALQPVTELHDDDFPVPIAIEAVNFTRAKDGAGLTWTKIANLGAGQGAVLALPQGRPSTTRADNVRLDYAVKLFGGDNTVQLELLPTLNTSGGVDVRIGVALDDRPMQTLATRLTPAPGAATTDEMRNWRQAVIDNNVVFEAKFPGVKKGKHIIKLWRLDDNVVLTKIVIPAPTTPNHSDTAASPHP